MPRTADQLLDGIIRDLPSGWAWRSDDGSMGRRLLRPLAAELSRLDGALAAFLEEADPRTTSEMLDDWERALGLPDECTAGLTLIEQRRGAVVSRLTEHLSSTPAAFEAIAAAFGSAASIVEHREYTCEDSCEDPVNDEAWAFAWTMWSSARTVWEASCEDDCEQPLRSWAALPHECSVRRRAPAHTVPLFGAFEDAWEFLDALPAGATYSGTASFGPFGLLIEPGEDLRLAVPDGLYSARMEIATPAGAVATYPQPLLVAAGGSLGVVLPAEAVLAGADHLRLLVLRKVT